MSGDTLVTMRAVTKTFGAGESALEIKQRGPHAGMGGNPARRPIDWRAAQIAPPSIVRA